MNRKLFKMIYRSVRAHRQVWTDRDTPFRGTMTLAHIRIMPGNCRRVEGPGAANRRYWLVMQETADLRRARGMYGVNSALHLSARRRWLMTACELRERNRSVLP